MSETSQSAAGEGRLALFDLDNTLFDRTRAFRSWCESFVARRALDPGALSFLLEVDRDGHATRSEVFGPLRDRFGLPESVAELEATYREEYPLFFARDRRVIAGVARLKQHGWTVIIVTNGPPAQIRKIEACGLSAVVDGWCISEIVGSAKPDRRIFDAAAELAQLPLRGWMVGDTSSADVVGGRAVGLGTIWLARGRAEPEQAELRADLTVETVFDAFEAILQSRADGHT